MLQTAFEFRQSCGREKTISSSHMQKEKLLFYWYLIRKSLRICVFPEVPEQSVWIVQSKAGSASVSNSQSQRHKTHGCSSLLLFWSRDSRISNILFVFIKATPDKILTICIAENKLGGIKKKEKSGVDFLNCPLEAELLSSLFPKKYLLGAREKRQERNCSQYMDVHCPSCKERVKLNAFTYFNVMSD